MKKISFYLLTCMTVFLLACTNNDQEVEENLPATPENQVSFDASLRKTARATDTQFDVNDAIGVFAVSATSSYDTGYLLENGNYADNVKYIYNGSRFTTDRGIRIEGNGQKLCYHAIYPYVRYAGPIFYFDVKANQQGKNYTQSDLCTASAGATDETLVHLTFAHRLSKVIITLKGDNWPAGDMSFKLNDVVVGAKANLNTLEFNSTDNTDDVICAENGTKSFKAILPPQTLSEGKDFGVLTIGGRDITASLNGAQTLESGKQLELVFTYDPGTKLVEFSGDIQPWEDIDNRLNDVVPEEIRKKMENYMPIYSGINPPNVEGVYFIDPFVTVYCEDQEVGGFEPGEIVMSSYIRFSNQRPATNQVDFEERNEEGTSFEIGNGAFISGSGQNFTAFFNTEGKTNGIWTKTALVISGSKTSNGIEDLKYAFVMVDKGDDPEHDLMDVGIFRVFEDQDRLAENSYWPSNTQKAKLLFTDHHLPNCFTKLKK